MGESWCCGLGLWTAFLSEASLGARYPRSRWLRVNKANSKDWNEPAIAITHRKLSIFMGVGWRVSWMVNGERFACPFQSCRNWKWWFFTVLVWIPRRAVEESSAISVRLTNWPPGWFRSHPIGSDSRVLIWWSWLFNCCSSSARFSLEYAGLIPWSLPIKYWPRTGFWNSLPDGNVAPIPPGWSAA